MNPNIKKRNKSLNKYLGSQKEKQKLIENSLKTNFYINNDFDNFQSTVSNITKQLNNISLKSFSHIKINPNIINEEKNISKNFDNNKNQIKLKINKNNSFSIKAMNLNEKNELKKENENLKGNIKFLLGQIKKYQKSGINIEDDYKNNFNIIIEKDNEIKKLNKKILFLEQEIKEIKEKYNELKIKYEMNINNNIINTNSNANSNNISMSFNENKLYQYNSKKNNFYNYENSKNNLDNLDNINFNSRKFIFHKARHTTDFSYNNLLNNHAYNNIEDKENYFLIYPKKSQKKFKNNKYLSLMTSANKNILNKESNNNPSSTKAYNNNSFLYKKSPIKSKINKSLIGKRKVNNFLNINDSLFNNSNKENKKISEILYFKKNNNSNISIINNNNPNIILTSTRSYSSKFSYNEELNLLPKLDISPNDLYYFFNYSLYNFKIDEMKFSIINYSLNEKSKFKLYYDSTINHSNDILLSISNGFLIITGPDTNYLYFYSKENNKIYDLNKLNKFHNKGSLIKINNDQIICISGINTTEVEKYSIKDNKWIILPKMNCPHSESSYMIYNSDIIFSFFGYDYENNKYINDIEYLFIKNNYNKKSEKKWNLININNKNFEYNLRSHSIFYRINKENNEQKEIFIVGGYNNFGRNNGLIQIFLENKDMKFNINFKKYEENMIKVKGTEQNLERYNNNENIFLFQNEFYQYFDEEDNLFYNYNYDSNFNIHIIDNFTLKHTIYRNKLNN